MRKTKTFAAGATALMLALLCVATISVSNAEEASTDSEFFVVFNTFFQLYSQEAQVRCFANVAEHLTDDGLFVIEVQVPPIQRFRGDNFVDIYRVDRDRIMLGFEIADGVPGTVAAGMGALAIGTDGAGSIRIRNTRRSVGESQR